MNQEISSSLYPHQTINIPNLPPLPIEEYNQRKTPPCLATLFDGIVFPCQTRCGNFNFSLIQHTGEPIILSPKKILNTKDHYLDLTLKECHNFKEAINSLNELAKFVKKYEGINWLVGVSWLGSIYKGDLIKRYGFYPTDIRVPYLTRKGSKEMGLRKNNPTPSYIKLVEKSKPVFIYAPRNEFISHFNV